MKKSRGIIKTRVQELLDARDLQTAQKAQKGLVEAARLVVKEVEQGQFPTTETFTIEANHLPLERRGFPVSALPDASLDALNNLLPWAAYTLDEHGRSLGLPWSSTKRARPQSLVERRHVALNATYPFAGKHILEVGCFEGIHSISCLELGGKVTAVDARIDNLVKTLVRLWAYGAHADVMLWDLEEKAPAAIPTQWDMLHHIGVLYHLTDPVRHLQEILSRTKEALLLDTHIARDDEQASHSYEVGGKKYAYHYYPERTGPFAGMLDHAKWLRLEDLMSVIADNGFPDVRLIEDRSEANGRRVALWAFREGVPLQSPA